MINRLGTGFGSQILVYALGDLASQAIAHNQIHLLRLLINQQQVDLNTLNTQGLTLLMEAMRRHNPNALLVLLNDSLDRQIVPDLMHRDHQDNTVLHYMAMHLPDAWFDEPSDQPVLEDLLEQFFNDLREDFDWEHHNAQGLTAVELAQTAHKDNLVGFLQTYEVAVEETSASNDIEPSESFHSDSEDPGDPGTEGQGLLA